MGLSEVPEPTVVDVQAAARRIEPYVHRTPVFTSAYLDEESGARLFFKCENLQKVGAFKMRGATNFVLQLSSAQAASGVVTHSSGNHGQAVAAAARVRGVAATVVMPRSSAAVKRVAVAGYGDLGPGYITLERSFAEGGYEPTDAFVSGASEAILRTTTERVLHGSGIDS